MTKGFTMATFDGDGVPPDPSLKNERVRGVIVERRGWYLFRVID